jgi:hypothetical protein
VGRTEWRPVTDALWRGTQPIAGSERPRRQVDTRVGVLSAHPVTGHRILHGDAVADYFEDV